MKVERKRFVLPTVSLGVYAAIDDANRPPIFHMAHVLHRHRKTQRVMIPPPIIQRILFPVIIFLGTLLGKYRGTNWPGCPACCTGAPLSSNGGNAR